MYKLNVKSEKTILLFILFVALFGYLLLGIYTEIKLIEAYPLPAKFHGDFLIYKYALFHALYTDGPYTIRHIGLGFLYPPPSLLIIEIFSYFPSAAFSVAVYSTVNIILMLLMIYGVAYRYGYSISDVWWWFPIGIGFAPFLELLHNGQINLISLFGIFLLFFWERSLPIFGGISLSFGIVTKVTPLAFLGYLFVTDNVKAIIGSLLGVIILCVLAGLRYGYEPFITYIDVFKFMLHQFPINPNSQSLVSKLSHHGFIVSSNIENMQKILTYYTILIFLISGILTYFQRQREPLFIVVCLGMTLTPNVMWYHHYIFLLLPLFIWMGWSRLKIGVVIWCWIGLFLIQVDPRWLTYGLLVHIFGHISILAILAWQMSQVYSMIRGKNEYIKQ